MRVLLKKLPNFPTTVDLPSYATPGAAGMDLYSAESHLLYPGSYKLIHTGVAIALPEPFEADVAVGTWRHELQVRPRSGLAFKHGVTLLNSPGTIDADYRGEIGAILVNHGEDPFQVEVGMRIAQLVFAVCAVAHFEEVAELPPTERGSKGFGSTGTHGLRVVEKG